MIEGPKADAAADTPIIDLEAVRAPADDSAEAETTAPEKSGWRLTPCAARRRHRARRCSRRHRRRAATAGVMRDPRSAARPAEATQALQNSVAQLGSELATLKAGIASAQRTANTRSASSPSGSTAPRRRRPSPPPSSPRSRRASTGWSTASRWPRRRAAAAPTSPARSSRRTRRSRRSPRAGGCAITTTAAPSSRAGTARCSGRPGLERAGAWQGRDHQARERQGGGGDAGGIIAASLEPRRRAITPAGDRRFHTLIHCDGRRRRAAARCSAGLWSPTEIRVRFPSVVLGGWRTGWSWIEGFAALAALIGLPSIGQGQPSPPPSSQTRNDGKLSPHGGRDAAPGHSGRHPPAALAGDEVRVSYVGHSTFLIESPQGVKIATDYNDYVKPPVIPDIATMNHAHSTHYTDNPDPASSMCCAAGAPAPTSRPAMTSRSATSAFATCRPTSGILSGGAERHGNSIFVFEIANLCIAHLGHLHHTLNQQQLNEIGRIDAVMVPVDGSVTLDLEGMAEVLKALKAPLMLPMHYFSTYSLRRFLDLLGEKTYEVEMAETPSVVISKATLPTKPKLLVLPGRMF